jgi:methylase of polypeptide subunit release factors
MSGERIIPGQIISDEEYLLYLKGEFLYDWATTMISGDKFCLDIGCGDGYGAASLAKAAGQVVAIDISRDVVRKAEAR